MKGCQEQMVLLITVSDATDVWELNEIQSLQLPVHKNTVITNASFDTILLSYSWMYIYRQLFSFVCSEVILATHWGLLSVTAGEWGKSGVGALLTNPKTNTFTLNI